MEAAAVLSSRDLARALERSADAVAARTALERILDAHPGLAGELVDRAVLRDGLVAIACASRSLTNAIVGDESLLTPLRDDDTFAKERTLADFRASAAAAGAAADESGGALRRWKRTEYVRIAARDLLGVADLPAVGRELAALAQECLERALALTDPQVGFAVIGMGKLGGCELNYSSDVDVLFVHDGDSNEADRVARALLSVMTASTADGIVFRTDADLRPEGRAGALTRNLESYGAWYERWARPWEFQALIKARPVAGDEELGAAFMALTRPHVWPEVLDPDAVREARAMKGRAEAELQRKGLTDRELKRGRGGIRDIEFAVQLLQLVHARHDPSIRSATTLDALRELGDGEYVEPADVERMREAYTFLRTVEHRLQLWDEQQTHTLPDDPVALTRLARVMGYRDAPEATALEAFDAEHKSQQAAVRSIHERLFFAPLLETFAGAGAMPTAVAEERLAAFGFLDSTQTRAALRELTRGLTRSSRLMQRLMPVILDWLSTTPDPDLGLLQLRKLAEGDTRASALATTFRDMPGAAERVCRILGSSRLVGDALLRQPEVVERLGDDDWLTRVRTVDELRETALETLQWREDPPARQAGLRRFKRRQLLRIASRDMLGLVEQEVTARELADLGDACVEAALRSLDPSLPFAVIGMGRFGGHELSFASDIDVLFVYDGDTPEDFDTAERLATDLMAEIGATTAEGQTFRVDANLRPEGKQGPLARSIEGFRQYYERWALPWELQSLLRARAVAGDLDLAARYLALVEPYVYREHLPEDDVREIRRIKARVERERIPPGEDPQFHLKLGKGALTDVEFAVQLLQLQHGAAHPEIREQSTVRALGKLAHADLLDVEDAAVLAESYELCERARNATYLVTGRSGDAIPTGADAARIGRLLGYTHRPEPSLRDDFRRVTRRARKVFERVFYAQDT